MKNQIVKFIQRKHQNLLLSLKISHHKHSLKIFFFCRTGQQDPIDFFTTLTNETKNQKFPEIEKNALLEPFNFLLQPWIFCTKNDNHKSSGGISIQRFIEISKPEDIDGLQQGLEDYFQDGVPVIGWHCPNTGNF